MTGGTAAPPMRRLRHCFRDLPLSAKVALVPSLILLLMTVMLWLAVRTNADHTATVRALDQDVFEPLHRAQMLKDEITLLHARLFALLSVGTNEVNSAEQSRQASETLTRLKGVEADVAHFLQSAQPILGVDGADLRRLFEAYDSSLRETVGFAFYDMSYGALLAKVADQRFSSLRADLDIRVQHLAERRANLAARAVHESERSRKLLLGIDIAGTMLALLGALLVAPAITSPLLDLIRRLDRLARGETALVVPGVDRRDEVGSMARAVEVFRDSLIARRESEALVQRTNLLFESALNNMLHGLLVWGPDRRIQLVNNPFLQLCRLKATDVRPGMTLEQYVSTLQEHGLCADLDPVELARTIDRRIGSGVPTLNEVAFRPDQFVRVASAPMAGGASVTTFEDVTEKRRSQQQIEYLAHHDTLTGLPNRALFQKHMEQFDGANRGGGCAVLCLDLDRFKDVNDTLGHPAGDELLRQVAVRLRGCVRERDPVARLGGDEFAILLTDFDAGLAVATALADRLVQSLSVPYDLQGHEVAIGTSVGIALSAPGLTGAELMKQADMALYQAKAERGMFMVFEQGMDETLRVRKTLEAEMRVALQRHEFELHYQPQYSLIEDRVSGFEALLRWRSPTRGPVSPAEFVAIAEETGLIMPLGEWALRAACRAAARWPDTHRIAVNVSARQMRNPVLPDLVRDALNDAGLPAQRLEIEITETALLRDTDAVRTVLRQLHEMGVQLALDDFGTGYSSLSYLRQFPFDKIKIDRSFIKDIQFEPGEEAAVQPNDSAATIVRAIVGLGANLGMATIAEGVESAQQFIRMRRKGCSEVQGYFISPAVPETEIPDVVRRVEAALASRNAGRPNKDRAAA